MRAAEYQDRRFCEQVLNSSYACCKGLFTEYVTSGTLWLAQESPGQGGFCVLGATGLGLDLKKRGVVGLLLHLKRRVLDPVAIAEQELDLAPRPVAVVPGATTTWAASASNPGVTDQTWSSCTSRTPGDGADRAGDRVDVDPGGAASIKTSSGSRTSRIDEARIEQAIAMLASGSIGRQPVARMTPRRPPPPPIDAERVAAE